MNWKRTFATGVIAIISIGFAGFFWIWAAPCALGGCAPLDDLAEFHAEGSELFDANGEPFARLATVNRRIVSLDSLPDYLPAAFLAIEDRRFYSHSGIDIWRTVGALINNLRSGSVQEGGSTITQQLARNLFPDWLPYTDRNLRRKVLEARVARQIERTFSKEKILELYLNHIYLGSGAYGVEAAALTYFGKPASELTLTEAATIAGIAQAPSQINPRESLVRATRRRDLVLDAMVDAGFLSSTDAASAKAEPLEVAEVETETIATENAYFVEQVRRELEEKVGNRFYTEGLKIYTTLDPAVQEAAVRNLEHQLRAIESGNFGTYHHPTYATTDAGEGRTEYLQGAVVVLDAITGEVHGLVGGRDFSQSKFNRATQALRQSGSAFKPFIYAAALQHFGSPAHIVEDTPIRLTLAEGQTWEPRNYSDQYDGMITMREAITRSKNVATVRLAEAVGIGAGIGIARQLGITSDIPNVPSTALGAADVRPIELAAAYAAFANGGYRITPHLIREIEDRNGNTIWSAGTVRQRVLDPAVAFVLTTMLEDVVNRGTGAAVRAVGFRGPAAGKTGTTNDASDVWFLGYTPELVAGIWIGLDEPSTIVSGASGGTLAAPVWGRMMREIYQSRTIPDGWPPPPNVTTAEVDAATGAIVSPDCPAIGPVYTEYFLRGTASQQGCPRFSSPYRDLDSLWIDEEWSASGLDLDSLRVEFADSGGIDFPELEALRRRIRAAEEEFRLRQGRRNPTDTSTGNQSDEIEGSGRRTPIGEPVGPPSRDSRTRSDGDGRVEPPQPAEGTPDRDGGDTTGPRLLGVPVQRGQSQ